MKLLILGAGAIGSAMAEILAGRKEFEKIILADLKRETAQAVADRIGKGRVITMAMNANDVADMKAGMKDVDLVVNAVLPRFFLKIMQAALESGTSYMDMATDLGVAVGEPAGKVIDRVPIDLQLDQDARWKEAGLSAMLCWGNDPGAVNVYARYAADGMDEVEKILVRDGDTGYVEGYDGFVSFWSPDTLIEEVAAMNAVVWTKGRFERVPSLTVSEEFDFPPPVGRMRVWAVDHEEPETLVRFIGKGCKECNFMLGLGQETVDTLKVLQKLGLTGADPIDVKGMKVYPRDVITALMPSPNDPDLQRKARGTAITGTVVIGRRNGRRVSHYVYQKSDYEEVYRKYGVTAVAWQTAMPPSIAAVMFARGEITRKGVYPPEALEPRPILERFNEFGFVWSEEKKDL